MSTQSLYKSGDRIADRYEIVGPPLAGGMGIVYLCFDNEEQRPVALKTFKPEFLPDLNTRDRFLREGSIWVSLGKHRHIVHCYGVVRTLSTKDVYLVLELVSNRQSQCDASLRSWLLPDRPLPIETALLFALQIVRGMRHATQVFPNLVHRDLKPENILVGADRLSGTDMNCLRVTDFGLVNVLRAMNTDPYEQSIDDKLVQTNDTLYQTRLTQGAVGTPLYMAPEQWKGESLTAATDIYALGCILYEMLSGKRIVKGSNCAEVKQAHCTGQLQPLPKELPIDVEAILQKSLTTEPEARYNRWEDIENAIIAAYQDRTHKSVPEAESSDDLSQIQRIANGWSYNRIGWSYLDIGKLDVALKYFKMAEEIGHAEGELSLASTAINNLGVSYQMRGSAGQAVGFHERALKLAEEIGDLEGRGNCLRNLGEAYRTLGDLNRAKEFHMQSLEMSTKVGSLVYQSADLGNLGLIHMYLGEYQQSISYLEHELNIVRRIGDRQQEAKALNGLGNVYHKLGAYRQAQTHHAQALKIAQAIVVK